MTANTFATEEYADDAAAGAAASVVDAAPGTLDTLNELAAALGDDANFATTTATSLGTKVPNTRTVNGHALSSDVTVTKGDVGLGNADNTADSAKAFAGSQITSGTVADARIDSAIARDSEVTSAVAAEAALARNADNLTSGTVADARIASTLARDSEVTSAVGVEATARDAAIAVEAALARNADNLTSGTVADARIASTIARDSEVTSAVAAEATLARNADNLTSGTVAIARLPLDADVATLSLPASTTISAFAATLLDDTTNDAARVTLGFTAENIDFGGFKAIALACDNGATVPTSPAPTLGQWFLHTPTGRKVLMQYDGATWWPISAYGTTTVYVDKTDGTDAVDKGGAVDSGAYKTIQYAVDQIPPIFTGNVVVNVNGETYAETVTIGGKLGRGTSTLTIQGTTTTLDSGLAVAAVGTSSFAGGWGANPFQYPTIARTSGTWTANQRQNKWLWMTSGASNGETRLIDTNTTTALRPMGRLIGGIATNDTFDVREPTTTVNKFIIGTGQGNVVIADLVWNLGGTVTVDDCFGLNSETTIRRCTIPSTVAASFWVQNAAKVVFDTTYFTRFRVFVRSHSFVKFVGTKVEVGASSGTNTCVQQDQFSVVLFSDGCVLEGSDTANSEGVLSTSCAFTNFNGDYRQAASSTFPTTIRNCTIGVSVAGNGVVFSLFPIYVLYGDIRGSGGTDDTTAASTNTTTITTNELRDSAANFTGLGVAVGDKVAWITTARTLVWATVTVVNSATRLTLDADIFTASGRRYYILKDTSLNGTDDVAATGGLLLV